MDVDTNYQSELPLTSPYGSPTIDRMRGKPRSLEDTVLSMLKLLKTSRMSPIQFITHVAQGAGKLSSFSKKFFGSHNLNDESLHGLLNILWNHPHGNTQLKSWMEEKSNRAGD